MASILVVDDVAENRNLLIAVLGWQGHRVLEATDGRHALDVLSRQPVDLVITDLLMPAMDGFELARHLATDETPEPARRPRVLFYSDTYTARDALALGRLCGVLGLIEKPADPDAVLEAVAKALAAKAPVLPAMPGVFEREHLRLVTTHAAEAQAQKRVTGERLQRLQRFGAQMLEAKGASDICRALCATAREMALAGDGAVGLYPFEADPRGLIVRGVLGGALFERVGFPPDENEPPHAVKGAAAESVAVRLELGRAGGHGLLAIPLDTPSRRHGWLCVAGTIGRHDFSVEDGDVLAALGVQAALALENHSRLASLTARAEQLAAEIVERRRAERLLREAEARTQFALESTHIGLWEIDLRTGAVEHGSGLEAIAARAGRPMARSLGEFLATVVEEDLARVQAALESARQTRTDVGVEFRMTKEDGSIRWLEAKAHVVCDKLGVPERLVGVVADITERRTLEAQLHEAQKMEAVGQLAGGIAHDFNNVLTAIVGFSDLLAMSAANDLVRADVGEIRRAAHRAATLTRQLLAFSRRQVLRPSVIDVGALVEHLIPMLRRLIGEDIELRLNAAEPIAPVCVDPGQLEQVLLNLVINARDAMPGGGRISVDLANSTLTPDDCAAHVGTAPGQHVCMAVTDTGTGMDAHTRKHLFEPFFTTKPVGKGTGLGLATVHGIVKQSGGHVWVYSELGRGSTFKVYLPVAPAREHVAAVHVEPEPAPRGWETVLLAEDETSVREYVGRVLRGLGYTVIEAASGDMALELARKSTAPIHLLLSDVVMPGSNGPDVHRQLASDQPALKVLFMSGYPGDAIVARGFDHGCVFIEKPFTSELLARRVRDVLDGAA